MRKIKKIVFKNTLGITEKTLEPGDINIFQGKKGSGKTSMLDAINKSISNKNIRSEFVHKGEEEATMYIEFTDGMTIEREKHINKSDKVVVKKDGEVVPSPESFLKTLFNDNQFRPIAFVEAKTAEQNKILLSLVDIKWTMEDIHTWFNEIPAGVNFEDHILNILDKIQSKSGKYYMTREDINRDIRNKKAIAEGIIKQVPENYSAEKWQNVKLSDLYAEVSKATEHNRSIEDNTEVLMKADGLKESVQTNFKLAVSEIESSVNSAIVDCSDKKEALQRRIDLIKTEMNELDMKRAEVGNNKVHKIEAAAAKRDSELKYIESQVKTANAFNKQPIDTIPLKEAAEHAENMKSFLNEYAHAMNIHKEIEGLAKRSEELTDKIEVARNLPTELLKKVKTPVAGLTVSGGKPYINGLLIENLSTGEQLELAVEIAKALVGDLGIILVDKLECLNPADQDIFIESCKKSDLQYFMTKVCDGEFDIVKL